MGNFGMIIPYRKSLPVDSHLLFVATVPFLLFFLFLSTGGRNPRVLLGFSVWLAV